MSESQQLVWYVASEDSEASEASTHRKLLFAKVAIRSNRWCCRFWMNLHTEINIFCILNGWNLNIYAKLYDINMFYVYLREHNAPCVVYVEIRSLTREYMNTNALSIFREWRIVCRNSRGATTKRFKLFISKTLVSKTINREYMAIIWSDNEPN